jgi:EpsI family protein
LQKGELEEGRDVLGGPALGEMDAAGGDDRQRASRKPGYPGVKGISWLAQALVAVIILGGTLGLSYGIDFREKVPAKKTLTLFPLQVGEWQGKRQFMGDELINTLHLSDYTMIDYRNPGRRTVDFYVAYYESQRKGESTHTPATCLPGSGWVFEDSGLLTFPTPGHLDGSLTVSRAFMTKMNARQLVYYWFPQRGRILHSLFELKFFAFWDALIRQRTDGALIRLITPLSELEPAEQGDQRLQEFTREILPLLAEYIPGQNAG